MNQGIQGGRARVEEGERKMWVGEVAMVDEGGKGGDEKKIG